MKHVEDALQEAVCRYLDAALPPGWLYWHTPNGGRRNAREAGRLKAMGVRAGLPDLAIAGPHRLFFVELKAPKTGRVSDAQIVTMAALSELGFETHVCRSVADVEAALSAAGVPSRARIAA